MKKTIAILMMLFLLLTVFIVPSITADEVNVVGYSSARIVEVDIKGVPNILNYDEYPNPGAFKITTAEGLVEFRTLVGFGESFQDITIYLANDIDMAEVENFKPISVNFKGTFDGQGKMIENLKITESSDTKPVKIGLFASLNTATVKNLIIGPGSEIRYTGTADDVRIAAFIGSVSTGGNIDNCYNMGKIFGGRYTGGIVGFVEAGTLNTISNCTNAGDISAAIPANNCIAGGILGMAAQPQILVKNCRNIGNITSVGGHYLNAPAGGIVGRSWTAGLEIDGCINNGNITSETNTSSAGGILGSFQLQDVTMKNCTNYGTLTATKTGLWAHQQETSFVVNEENNFNKAGDADPTLATDVETITPDFTPNEGEVTKPVTTTAATTAATTVDANNTTQAANGSNQTTSGNGAETTTEAAKTKGCSSVTSGALIVVMGTGALLTVYKKKKKD